MTFRDREKKRYQSVSREIFDKDPMGGLFAGKIRDFCLLNPDRNLEKSIEQRNLTIFRVASEIVSKQKEFFLKGEKHLKPMILNEIGEELSLHESTISRVVNGKYMQTPRGIFEFKYFYKI